MEARIGMNQWYFTGGYHWTIGPWLTVYTIEILQDSG